MKNIKLKSLFLVPLILAAVIIGVYAQGFGTLGVSSRELPLGLCVVEIDEVIDPDLCSPCIYRSGLESCQIQNQQPCPAGQMRCSGITCVPREQCNENSCEGPQGFKGECSFECIKKQEKSFDLVITETGRKPAFAVVDRLLVYGQDEILEQDDLGLASGQSVSWDGRARTVARTLNNIITGVPEKTAVIVGARTILSGPGTSVFSLLDDFPIASQGKAGEVRTRLTASNGASTAFNLHIVAAIESPVGNLCSMNLVPVR